jgi:hypothetical protein
MYVTPCTLVVHRRFEAPCVLPYSGWKGKPGMKSATHRPQLRLGCLIGLLFFLEDGGMTLLRNVGEHNGVHGFTS